jgi:hypothetical protein
MSRYTNCVLQLLPELYRPLRKRLLTWQENLQSGIQCVLRANGYIDKLSAEIANREPEVRAV